MSNSKPMESVRLDRGLQEKAQAYAETTHEGYTRSDVYRDALRVGLPQVVGPPWWATVSGGVAKWAAMFAMTGSMFALAGLATNLLLFMTGFATVVAVLGGSVRAFAARRR